MRVPCLTSLPLRMRVTRHNMAVGAGATPVLLLSSRFSTRARFVDRVNPCANLFTIELCVAQIPTESCRSTGVEDLFSREMNPRLNPRRNVARRSTDIDGVSFESSFTSRDTSDTQPQARVLPSR
ncbi:unnamed protein product [Lasius platythorax]|uniref:Uncharacterized protein n=1 Tax=Lasius platythorax TaxID=488582 RepID=A0AAV2NB15_9HYME